MMSRTEIENLILAVLAENPERSWKKVRLVFYIARHNDVEVTAVYDALHHLTGTDQVYENGYAWLHELNWHPGKTRHTSPTPS